MPRTRALGLAIAVTLATAVVARTPQPPRSPARTQGRVLALVGATLIDGFGSTPIRNSVILDQDQMAMDEVAAVVDQAHKRGLAVVAHAHRPEEIRRAMRVGVDDLEHTGLATAPEYPADIIDLIKERTAQMSLGPFFWTPTIEGLWNYEYMRDHPEMLDDPSWQVGLAPDIVADIRASIQHPDQMSYFQLTPARKPTLKRKFEQLRAAGVTMLVGTDKEVGTITPGKFADVIAVRGDVLRYIDLLQRVDVVIKHGKRYR